MPPSLASAPGGAVLGRARIGRALEAIGQRPAHPAHARHQRLRRRRLDGRGAALPWRQPRVRRISARTPLGWPLNLAPVHLHWSRRWTRDSRTGSTRSSRRHRGACRRSARSGHAPRRVPARADRDRTRRSISTTAASATSCSPARFCCADAHFNAAVDDYAALARPAAGRDRERHRRRERVSRARSATTAPCCAARKRSSTRGHNRINDIFLIDRPLDAGESSAAGARRRSGRMPRSSRRDARRSA